MYKDMIIWGREFSIEIVFDVFKGEEILPEQKQALDSFTIIADKILSDSTEIKKYCADHSNGEVTLPIENIFRFVIPTQLFVTRMTDVRQVVLLCDFKFDEESGCALVFENENLIKICTQEEI